MDAALRLILDTKALLQRLSDVVREWTASTSRMSRAADGVDFDLAQREANQLRQVVEQMAAGVVGNLAKIDAAAQKIKTDASEREVKQLEKSILQLSNAAEREFAKMQRAAERIQLQKLRKEAKDAQTTITQMAKAADKELRVVEKAAERIQFKRAKEEARAVEQAIRTLEQSGTRSFRALEQRAEAAGVRLQSGIGGALTRLPPQVQALQRRFEAAMAAMRNAADRVSFQKAQAEAQRLEAAIHRMGQAAQRDLDRIKQAADRSGSAFGRLGGVVGKLNTVLGSLGIFLSARILAQWAGDAINAAIQLEAFNAQLRASTKSTAEANELYSFANEQTERLGLNFASVVEGTARFAAATKNTNLTLIQRKDILLSVFEAARVLNLSEQRLSNTLLALEQIASKATVSMEELRRQLGDNIPGAVAILADQMDVSQEKLLRMIETNQVLSEEALPLLAKGFRETFGEGVQESTDTFAASLGRVRKEIFDAKVAFGEGFAGAVREDLEDSKSSIESLIPVMRILGAVVGVSLQQLFALLSGFRSIALAGQVLGGAFANLTGVLDISDPVERSTQAVKDLDNAVLAAFENANFGSFESALQSVHSAFLLAADGAELTERQTKLINDAVDELAARAENAGIEVPKSFGIIRKALEGGGVEARTYAKDLIEALESIKVGDLRKAVLELSDAWNDSIQSGKVARDLLDEFGPILRLLIVEMQSAGREIPQSLRAIAAELEVDLSNLVDASDRVADALEEAAERAKAARDELFGTRKAAEDLANQLRDLTHQLDLDNLTAGQSEAIRDLIDDIEEAFEGLGEDVPPDIELIAKAVEGLGYGALGTRDALREMAEEIRRTIEAAGDLDNLGEEKLDALRDKIQEVLDAFSEYGEQVPADIQAVADKLGVLSTIAEKELEKQTKAAEKAADAEEKAAKRRVDALERVAESFRKLREEIEGAADDGSEVAELKKQLDELEEQEFNFTGSLEDLGALQDEIAEVENQLRTLQSSQAATGESAQEMADSIDDAIRGLVDQLEPVYARLSESQRLSVESILSNLQLLGQDGVATGEDVSASLQAMINVLEQAGQPTADLRSALNDMRQGGLDVRSAFEALREEIEQSYQEMEQGPEGVAKSLDQLKKDVDTHVTELARLKNTYENTFNDIEKRMGVALTLWDRLIEKCEQYKQCISG